MDFSELETEWHPILNLPLLFNESLPKKQKYWWIAKCGHEVQNLIAERMNGSCIYCSGKKILIGFNDLASQNPTLSSEWHPTKNDRTAKEVTPKSSRRAWWLGVCGHEWETKILSRANGANCPFCAGRKILAGFNDLNTTHPMLVSEWHPTKNEGKAPTDIGRSSKQKLWWLGNCGHEWQATVSDRAISNTGCHFCSGYKVLAGGTDVMSKYPELFKELHPTKNCQNLDLSLESVNSQKKLWWLGACGHEWETTIQSRVVGSGCVYCSSSKLLEGFNDLASKNPELAAEWHSTKNGALTPNQVSAKSGKKFWWLGKCGHEWEAQLSNRANGAGCSVCQKKTILVGYSDLATKNPILAAQWHPTKNGELTPQDVWLTSNKQVWWLCEKGHEWKVSPNVRSAGSGCPYCSGNKVLSGYNDLGTVNPEIASQWHPTKNGSLTPQQVTKGSKTKVWWNCSLGHEWNVMVTERNYYNCPVCSGRKVLAGFNDLSSQNPDVASEWHPTKNGDIAPHQVTKSSGQKVWWQCDNKHEWFALVSDRSNGSGCPNCANHVSKAEGQIKDFLESLGLTVEGSNRIILGSKREIDLWIPSHKLGIEFNGIYWHKEKYRGKTFHKDKYLAAQKASIQLIQIWEDDWNQKPDLVKRILAQKLGVAEEMLAEETDVITVTKSQAEEFLNENYLQGYASGTHYLGLVSNGDVETLLAVMTLDEEPGTDGKVLNIVRYATRVDVMGGFAKLLDYATKTFTPESMSATADHCEVNEGLYENNGFITDKELPPDYMYVVRNERKPRSEYPLERFRDDSKLLWEEGLTEMELADLNDLDRIWDAGKTLYRLLLQS